MIGWWPNVSAYAKFAILTFLVINEPSLIEKVHNGQGGQVVQDLKQDLKTQFRATMVALPRGIRLPGQSNAVAPTEAAPATSAAPLPSVAQSNESKSAVQTISQQPQIVPKEQAQPAGSNLSLQVQTNSPLPQVVPKEQPQPAGSKLSLQPIQPESAAAGADRRWQPPNPSGRGVQR